MGRDTPLGLVLTNEEELFRAVVVLGSLSCSTHEMVEFRISRMNRMTSLQTTALDSRRANTGLLRDLPGGIPWDTVLGRAAIQDTPLTAMDLILQAQEQSIYTSWKPSCSGRDLHGWIRTSQLNSEIKEKYTRVGPRTGDPGGTTSVPEGCAATQKYGQAGKKRPTGISKFTKEKHRLPAPTPAVLRPGLDKPSPYNTRTPHFCLLSFLN
ncbi:hypothetical protein WISP_88886 [Willisornis vidua]|uniref:Uncharacterized protein n=1 Tax=Willisornis vidua TaxID=1566151 RepID=A0ABQ9D266_9PASS|nr:hypothetical protein WISP_88886 [Willisornis vidua]